MKKVVILDDEKIIVEGLSYFLRERFSQELKIVKTYYEAEEALIDLRNTSFDILITDICMSDMTGLELVKELRKSKDFESIIVSAYHNFDYAKESIDLGVKTYLTKPIDFEKLSDTITKILNEKSVVQPESIDTRQYSSVIHQVLNIIHANFNKELQLSDLADELHYNAAYLGQLFNKEVGQTFNGYILDQRLKEAEKLLQTSGLSIDEISNTIGFQTPAYFIRVFKKNYRITPLKYRKLNR